MSAKDFGAFAECRTKGFQESPMHARMASGVFDGCSIVLKRTFWASHAKFGHVYASSAITPNQSLLPPITGSSDATGTVTGLGIQGFGGYSPLAREPGERAFLHYYYRSTSIPPVAYGLPGQKVVIEETVSRFNCDTDWSRTWTVNASFDRPGSGSSIGYDASSFTDGPSVTVTDAGTYVEITQSWSEDRGDGTYSLEIYEKVDTGLSNSTVFADAQALYEDFDVQTLTDTDSIGSWYSGATGAIHTESNSSFGGADENGIRWYSNAAWFKTTLVACYSQYLVNCACCDYRQERNIDDAEIAKTSKIMPITNGLRIAIEPDFTAAASGAYYTHTIAAIAAPPSGYPTPA